MNSKGIFNFIFNDKKSDTNSKDASDGVTKDQNENTSPKGGSGDIAEDEKPNISSNGIFGDIFIDKKPNINSKGDFDDVQEDDKPDTNSDKFNFSKTQLSDAIKEVELGVDNEYNMRMNEIVLKRKEYLKIKAKRRLETAGERMTEAVSEGKLLAQLKAQQMAQQINRRVDNRPNNPLTRIDTNSRFNSNDNKVAKDSWKRPTEYIKTSGKMATKALGQMNIHLIRDTENRSVTLTEKKSHDYNSPSEETVPQKKLCSRNRVLIQNLSPNSDEYKISALSKSIGAIHGVIIRLEVNGKRDCIVHFVLSTDAIKFERKYNGFKLDSFALKLTVV